MNFNDSVQEEQAFWLWHPDVGAFSIISFSLWRFVAPVVSWSQTMPLNPKYSKRSLSLSLSLCVLSVPTDTVPHLGNIPLPALTPLLTTVNLQLSPTRPVLRYGHVRGSADACVPNLTSRTESHTQVGFEPTPTRT
jgi:hypothetical protein